MIKKPRIILCIALFLSAIHVQATTYTFTGVTGASNWSTAARWDANGIPPLTLPMGDQIVINCGANQCLLDFEQAIDAGATLTINSGELQLATAMAGFNLYNSGIINIESGAKLSIASTSGNVIKHFGIININGGVLNIYDSVMDVENALAEINVNANGELRIEGGSLSSIGKLKTVATGTVINQGGNIFGSLAWTHSGTYTCDAGATIRPTTSTFATMTITGSLTQCSDGSLSPVLYSGGHDVIAVSGTLTLNNSLLGLSLISGYTPTHNQTFDVITAGSIVGTFDLVASSIGSEWIVEYLPIGAPTKVRLKYNTVLPIELLNFDAHTEGSKNHLTWRTASEKNNSHFDIERSTDGTTFHNIGQVKGNNKPSSYQFVDNQPFATSYYRLRQIDFDGTETVSKVVSVVQTGKGKGLKIYPTLVSNGILTVDTEGGQLRDYSVMNLLGQQVLVGKTTQQIDVSALPQGTYLLKVGTEVAKFVKQ